MNDDHKLQEKHQDDAQGTKNKKDKKDLTQKPFEKNTGDVYPEQGNNDGTEKVDDMRAPLDVEVGDEEENTKGR